MLYDIYLYICCNYTYTGRAHSEWLVREVTIFQMHIIVNTYQHGAVERLLRGQLVTV